MTWRQRFEICKKELLKVAYKEPFTKQEEINILKDLHRINLSMDVIEKHIYNREE